MNNLSIQKVTESIDKALEQCSLEVIAKLPAMGQTIALAQGMSELRRALSREVVDTFFIPLQGTPLGFRTDKDDKGGYDAAIVRDCVIEAMIRGFRPIGNELNIIAGRAYFTKEGFERKVSEFPGLTHLELMPGVPVAKEGGALVPYRAAWILDGERMELIRDVVKLDDGSSTDQRIVVRVNGGMGADAILGKAKRKILAQIYERISGVKSNDGDVFDTTGEVVAERPAATQHATAALVQKHRETSRGREPGDES